jgi:hypothetical protein
MRSSQAGQPGAAPRAVPSAHRPDTAANPAVTRDESLLAAMYVRMWALVSDRPLPSSPPSELSKEELISFWADDFKEATGRHAVTTGGRR